MTFLEVKNLHVEVEGKKILNGLTLSVDKGQVAAIMPAEDGTRRLWQNRIRGK